MGKHANTLLLDLCCLIASVLTTVLIVNICPRLNSHNAVSAPICCAQKTLLICNLRQVGKQAGARGDSQSSPDLKKQHDSQNVRKPRGRILKACEHGLPTFYSSPLARFPTSTQPCAHPVKAQSNLQWSSQNLFPRAHRDVKSWI